MLTTLRRLISFRPSLETSVGVVLYFMRGRDPQFLLLRYPHGHWDFVKGHKEKGETDAETLLREVEEETTIQNVTILKDFRHEVRYRYTAKGSEKEKRQNKGRGLYVYKKVIYYVAEAHEARVELSDEHIDWSWISYEDALRMITHVNSRNILKNAHRHILTILGTSGTVRR